MLLGALAGVFRGSFLSLPGTSSLGVREITGKVLTVEEVEKGSRVCVKIETPKELSGKVYQTFSPRKISPGKYLRARVALEPPEPSPHPFGFNEEKWFLSKGISYRGKTLKMEELPRTPPRLDSLREYLRVRSSRGLTVFTMELRGFLESVLLGRQELLPEEFQEKVGILGLRHILAISGLHLGFLYGGVHRLLLYLSKRRFLASGGALFFSLIYLWVAGFPVSGWRVWLFLLVLLLLKIFSLPFSPLTVAGVGCFLQTLLFPRQIFSSGFWMSYGSYFGILWGYPKFKSLFYPFKNYVTESLSLTLGVYVFLLPILAGFNFSLGLLEIFGNVLLLPFYTLLIVLGFVHLFFALGTGFVFKPLVFGMELLFRMVLTVQDLLLPLQDYAIPLGTFTALGFFFYYFGVFVILGDMKNSWSPRMKRAIFMFLFAMALSSFAEWGLEAGNYRVDYIYVDQGDATLLRAGRKFFLVDTGGSRHENYRPGAKYTRPYLLGQGIRRLDGLFLTHFDGDHVEGYLDIAEDVDVHRAYVSHVVEGHPVLEKLKEKRVPIHLIGAGDSLPLPNGEVRVLHPGHLNGEDENDRSFTLEFTLLGNTFLFTGDATAEVEKEIPLDRPVDVLKLGHHGSASSSSASFLERARPRAAIVSAGRNNEYGHPAPPVVERLKEFGIPLFRTDKMGTILVEGRNIIIYPYGRRPFSFLEVAFIYFLYFIFLLLLERTWGLWYQGEILPLKEFSSYTGRKNSFKENTWSFMKKGF